MSRTSGLAFLDDARAFARVDWDHDGDLDLWIVNRTAPQVRLMRNDAGGSARSVAIRLEGKDVNRDGIGARVEVRAGKDRWVRVSQAGTGYISQSSKWMHFGVGDRDSVEAVTVHWPDGSTQRLGPLDTGHRYRVRQGEAAAERVATHGTREAVRLTASNQTVVEPTEVANIGLTWRVEVPRLRIRDFSGAEHTLGAGGRPLLINFWASWCPSCLHEMEEWTREKNRIRSAGLDILALAVDEIQADVGEDPARAVVSKLEFPFAAGSATDEVLLLFEVMQSSLIDRHRTLPVPVSFLIDASGKLARIYKGPVEVDQLVADVGLLKLTGMEAAHASLPFEGRWHKGPHFPGLMRIGDRLLEQQAPALANHFTSLGMRYVDRASPESRVRLAAQLARSGKQFVEAGKPAEGASGLQRAVALDPRLSGAWYWLGRARIDLGQFAEARPALERSVELNPDEASAWELLGLCHTVAGASEAAMTAYRESAEVDPTRGEPWLAMGAEHLTGGNMPDANRAFNRAVELDPELVLAWVGLGTTQCALGDPTTGRRSIERALELDPQNQRARTQLAACR